MWKWLHPYANPETSYQLTSRLIPWFAIVTFVLLSTGLIWALLFAPADYQQGDSFRIFYLHVPTASLSMGIYVGMAIVALCGLVWQLRLSEAAVAAIAPVGAVYTALALITGALWGKPMWGTYWIWDARLTTELILLFLYLGVMALGNAFEDKNTGGKAASILALVGVINIPIIKYSVEWWNTLHQGATVSTLGKPAMTMDMFYPFVFCFLGLAFFAAVVICIRFKTELLQRNAMRPWVKQLIMAKE